MGMGRPGPDLGPDPMASKSICEATGGPNLSIVGGLVDPTGIMG
jgi:hypothetical protein